METNIAPPKNHRQTGHLRIGSVALGNEVCQCFKMVGLRCLSCGCLQRQICIIVVPRSTNTWCLRANTQRISRGFCIVSQKERGEALWALWQVLVLRFNAIQIQLDELLTRKSGGFGTSGISRVSRVRAVDDAYGQRAVEKRKGGLVHCVRSIIAHLIYIYIYILLYFDPILHICFILCAVHTSIHQ